jgi:signal peptidase II
MEQGSIGLMRKMALLSSLLAADLMSKSWVFQAFGGAQKWPLIPGVSFYCCQNTGVAWSIGAHMPQMVLVSSSLLLLFFLYHFLKNPSLAMIFIVAGGLGNTFDRVFYGGVRDFILLSAGKYCWPVFNLADIYLTFGGLIIVLSAFKQPVAHS